MAKREFQIQTIETVRVAIGLLEICKNQKSFLFLTVTLVIGLLTYLEIFGNFLESIKVSFS